MTPIVKSWSLSKSRLLPKSATLPFSVTLSIMSDIGFVRKMKGLTANVCSEKTERTYVTKHGTISTMNTTNIGKSEPE